MARNKQRGPRHSQGAQQGHSSLRRSLRRQDVVPSTRSVLVAGIYAFAAFLLTLGVTAIVIGVHDAAIARTSFGVTAASVVLVVVGVTLFIAGCHLIRLSKKSRWEWGVVRPPCRPIVLVAFVLTVLLGVYVFFAAIQTRGTQRLVVVSVALALIGVALAGLRVFGKDARVTLPRLGAIALALVGTAIGAWQFWYQNQYVPARAGRAVALKVSMHLAGEQRAHHVVRATVEYEDIGGRSLSVIGSAYTLTGSRVIRCHRTAAVESVRPFFSGFLLDPQRSRFMADAWEIQPPTVLAAGKFVGDGKRLEPDVPSGRTLVFFVPRRRYQLLRFRAQLFAIPASVELSSLPRYETFAGDNYLYGYWHVEDDSWLHDLVYGRERWVVMRYELVHDPKTTSTDPKTTSTSSDLRVTALFPDPTWNRGRPSEAQVHELFGVLEVAPGRFKNAREDPVLAERPNDASEPFADTEVALEDVAAPNTVANSPAVCRRDSSAVPTRSASPKRVAAER
jgi:hypothetical protein